MTSARVPLYNLVLAWLRRVLQHARPLVAPVLEREAWLLAVSTVLITTLAYQAPLNFHLQIGSPLDEPFLTGIFAPERAAEAWFRWTRGRGEIDLPGLGAGVPLQVVLHAHGWRPEGQTPPRMELWLNGVPLAQLQLSRVWSDYVLAIPASRDANELALDFRTPTFRQTNDPRALGVAISDLTVEGTNVFGPTFPAPEQEERFILIALGIYFISRRMKFRPSTALSAGMALAVGGGLLIAYARPFLTVFSLSIFWIVVLDCAILLTLPPVIRTLFARGGVAVSVMEMRWAWILFLAVLSIRLVGGFYPHPSVGDSLFHLHLLQQVMRGQVLFSSTQGAIGFNQPIPYPPALYVLLTPLTSLVSDTQTLLTVLVALLDTTAALAVYYLVRQTGASPRAAWFAMALDLVLPISVLSFSWAIYANLMAQACLLLILALWVAQAQGRGRVALVMLAFVLTFALLSHVSAVPILIAFMPAAFAMLWFLCSADRKQWVVRPALALVAALLLSLGLYYLQFGGLLTTGAAHVMEARLARSVSSGAPLAIVGGGVKYPSIGLYRVPVYSVGEWVREGALGLGREAWVYYGVWPVLLALLGLALLHRQRPGRRLAALCWAGMLVGLSFALLGVVFDIYVRYPLLLLPFVAIGAGVALDALASRGRVWLFATACLLAVAMLDTLWLWVRFL